MSDGDQPLLTQVLRPGSVTALPGCQLDHLELTKTQAVEYTCWGFFLILDHVKGKDPTKSGPYLMVAD